MFSSCTINFETVGFIRDQITSGINYMTSLMSRKGIEVFRLLPNIIPFTQPISYKEELIKKLKLDGFKHGITYIENMIEANKKLVRIKDKILAMPKDIQSVAKELLLLLGEHKVCESHGILHAISVYENVTYALHFYRTVLPPKITIFQALTILNLENEKSLRRNKLIKLASLLHDADDAKFFPNNKNNENTRYLLREYSVEDVELVIKMINYVSTSKNGDSVPDDAKNALWMLYPRWADRLEALGEIGYLRCKQYNETAGHPLFTEKTERVTTVDELWEVASEDRYKNYCSGKIKSGSLIDHCYDKLLRLGDALIIDTDNYYFSLESKNRTQYIVDIVLNYGKTGRELVFSIPLRGIIN
jgi:hypothetical protein